MNADLYQFPLTDSRRSFEPAPQPPMPAREAVLSLLDSCRRQRCGLRPVPDLNLVSEQ